MQALRGALEAAGLEVLQVDHEDAHGQYELNFQHDEALRSADHLMLFKLAAHALAEARALVFSMMPKPFANQPGSGLHFHASLWQGGRCLFEGKGGSPLSPLARHFIAGVLAHSAALCALAAPTVNSYKRLTVGESLSGTSWAPAYVAHGPNNRTALVRTLPGRFEWRLPDASANPYLASAGLIAAGLDGIDRAFDAGPDCNDDLFALSLGEIRARGIALLPQSLGEAITAFEASALMQQTLGPTFARRVRAAQARRVDRVRAPRERLGARALRRAVLSLLGKPHHMRCGSWAPVSARPCLAAANPGLGVDTLDDARRRPCPPA